MLRGAVKRFGDDLKKISGQIKTKSVYGFVWFVCSLVIKFRASLFFKSVIQSWYNYYMYLLCFNNTRKI